MGEKKTMIASQKNKRKQLGMDPGTAANRLSRKLLYELGDRLDMQWCYHCAAKIEGIEDMSIEHKVPWLHSEDPVGLYFDMDNIAFSHKSCNYKAASVMSVRFLKANNKRIILVRGLNLIDQYQIPSILL